ncbi:MAG: tripartite tricarboxylate transporter TctB family protein [Sphaerochaetaceae bacterium]|nr:tripartite tricarboxylate transporter TctB family protein [Sphaerochaetaceae bacterium]
MRITKDKSVKIPTKIIIPILTILVGVLFVVITFTKNYGFWDSNAHKPTRGFFPLIIAIGTIGISLISLFNGLKDKEKMVEFKLENWIVPLGFIALLLVSLVFGFVLSITAFVIVWLKVYEQQSWKTTLISLAIVLFIVVGCFIMWLGIQFPQGLILDLILG